MEQLYEILGLDESASEGAIVEAVKALKQKIEDKNNIINGLTKQIKNYEEQVSSIAKGVAEARVKDLVRKVQAETGYHVGGQHMATLNRKAAQHLYANEEEQKSVWSDMKAHTIAYGAKLDMSKEIDSLAGDRDEGTTLEDKRYAKAKNLVESGSADSWEKAMKMVIAQEDESKTEGGK